MSQVPSELHPEILIHLPAESLFRFRAVCKSWLRIIDDPSFVRTHTTNNHFSSSPNLILFSTPDDGTLKSFPIDSLNYINGQQTVHVRHFVDRGGLRMPMCNGLLLVPHLGDYKNWEIWNPLNDTLQQLPQHDYEDRCLMGAGIGYESSSDDYKVVRIDRMHHNKRDGALYRTLIYSLKSNSWKRAKDCPHHDFPIREALFFKGALHWISCSTIVVLDMATEEYWLLPLPSPLPQMTYSRATIDAFGGEYLVMTVNDSAWVMRGYGGEKPFWEELFSSEQRRSVISGMSGEIMLPVAYNDTQRRLILLNGNTIIRWDIDKRAVQSVTFDGLQNCHVFYSQVVPGSLFRLNGGPVGAAVGTRSAKRKRSEASLFRLNGGPVGAAAETQSAKRKRIEASERLKFTATTTDYGCKKRRK